MLEGYIFIIMNNFYKSTPIFVLGLFFLSMPAFSYNSDPQKCADIPDPTARLSCYDALFQENKVTISKSPSSEYIVVNGLNNNESSSLKLFNLLGQKTLIKKLEINNPTQRILVSSLQSGIYIALLEVNGVSITKKIVIN